MILDLGYYLLGLSGALFYALYDTLQPSTPTLSQILYPVATTPTRIWLISWNQPKITVSLHQLFESYVCSFCINLFLVIGYLVKKRKKARSGESSFFINPTPLHHCFPYNDSCRYHPYHPQRQDQSHAYYQAHGEVCPSHEVVEVEVH